MVGVLELVLVPVVVTVGVTGKHVVIDIAPTSALQNSVPQEVHVAFEAAPIVALQVPAGQNVAVKESKGQKEPAGQMTGAPEKQ